MSKFEYFLEKSGKDHSIFLLDTCSQGSEERWQVGRHLDTSEPPRGSCHITPQPPWRWRVSHGARDLRPHSTVCLLRNRRKRSLIFPTKRCKNKYLKKQIRRTDREKSAGNAYDGMKRKRTLAKQILELNQAFGNIKSLFFVVLHSSFLGSQERRCPFENYFTRRRQLGHRGNERSTSFR